MDNLSQQPQNGFEELFSLLRNISVLDFFKSYLKNPKSYLKNPEVSEFFLSVISPRMDELKAQMDELKKQMEGSDLQLHSALDDGLTTMKQDLGDGLTTMKQDLGNRLGALEKKIDQVTALINTVGELRRQLDTNKGEYAKLKNDHTVLRTQFSTLQSAHKNKNEELDSTKGTVANLQRQLSETNSINQGLANQVNSLQLAAEATKKTKDSEIVDLQNRNKDLRDKFNNLLTQKQQLEKDKSSLEQVLQTKNEQYTALQNESNEKLLQKDDELSRAQAACGYYEARYQAFDEAFKIYESLPDNIRGNFRDLLGGGDSGTFIAGFMRWDGQRQIWNTAKYNISNAKSEATQLARLFEATFSIFCNTNPEYELIRPNEGDYYDTTQHNAIGNKTQGVISKVLLPGIRKRDDGEENVECQAIVDLMEV